MVMADQVNTHDEMVPLTIAGLIRAVSLFQRDLDSQREAKAQELSDLLRQFRGIPMGAPGEESLTKLAVQRINECLRLTDHYVSTAACQNAGLFAYHLNREYGRKICIRYYDRDRKANCYGGWCVEFPEVSLVPRPRVNQLTAGYPLLG